MAISTAPHSKFKSAEQARSVTRQMQHVLTYSQLEGLGIPEIAMAEEYLYEASMHLANLEHARMLDSYELFESLAS